MFIFDDLLALAPLALEALPAATAAAPVAAGTAAGAMGTGAAVGGMAAELGALTPELGKMRMSQAMAPLYGKEPLGGLGKGILGGNGGEIASLTGVPDEIPEFRYKPSGTGITAPAPESGMDWSKIRPYMQGANWALNMAGKLIPNKTAKQTLNLMSLSTGMGANLEDPQAAMKSMAGPLGDIAASTESEAEMRKKRLSQVMPAQAMGSAALPRPTATRFMRPLSRRF